MELSTTPYHVRNSRKAYHLALRIITDFLREFDREMRERRHVFYVKDFIYRASDFGNHEISMEFSIWHAERMRGKKPSFEVVVLAMESALKSVFGVEFEAQGDPTMCTISPEKRIYAEVDGTEYTVEVRGYVSTIGGVSASLSIEIVVPG